MKNYIHISILLILFTNAEIAIGQDSEQSKYSIQFNLGISRTLHYNQPVNLFQSLEGSFPEEQKPRNSPNVNLSIYRDFNSKNSLKIGFGSSSYRFWERAQSNVGDGITFVTVESVRRWSFYGLSLGYRFILNPERKVRLFVENEFIYEIPTQNYALLKSGLAIQPKIGGILNLNDNWSILVEGFFKSALTMYSDKNFGEDYKPYAYGVQLGVNLRI
ncbi:hypothetical protein [Maribacter sp. 4G9]|uniref:hypothetical protein n=1 Tax=Maribacter sp. 4G9 TaxID=1889777 RepID=UPI000C1613CE|nr:hypothetical protein [Maribacter sp. 4G9]PIB39157.1 hypothetical protein BFP75_12965 [Maribacter sp. 4G9]|tara:strand:+ start:735 stop:1385 length:651 start_codon:yes stop_codon:yes gene_type:complete